MQLATSLNSLFFYLFSCILQVLNNRTVTNDSSAHSLPISDYVKFKKFKGYAYY